MTSVTLSSFFSGLVSIVLAIYVKMSESLDTSNTVHSSSLKEVIEGLVIYNIKSSSYYITY